MAEPLTAGEIEAFVDDPLLIHTAEASRIVATIEALRSELDRVYIERGQLRRKVERRGAAVNRALEKRDEMRAEREAAIVLLRRGLGVHIGYDTRDWEDGSAYIADVRAFLDAHPEDDG